MLGSDLLLTPVRRSSRLIQTDNLQKVSSVDSDFAYVPNKSINDVKRDLLVESPRAPKQQKQGKNKQLK